MSTPEQRKQHREYQRQRRAQWTPEQKAIESERQAAYRNKHRATLNVKRRDFMREDRKRNKEKYADRDRLRKTGCSPELYRAMSAEQQGLCAACKGPPGRRALAADHCHESGLIRGLLCDACNTALGLLRECPTRMDALKDYINAFRWLK